ncbi:5434_t:CDS:1, partial [Acaulospora morrowiae]
SSKIGVIKPSVGYLEPLKKCVTSLKEERTSISFFNNSNSSDISIAELKALASFLTSGII